MQLSSGTVGYWAATGSAATGAYAAHAQLRLGLVSFGTAGSDVYRVDSLRYRGTKLESYVDTLSSTTYGSWYSHTGRLVAARATPGGSSQLAQNTLVCLTYNATKAYAPARVVPRPLAVPRASETSSGRGRA